MRAAAAEVWVGLSRGLLLARPRESQDEDGHADGHQRGRAASDQDQEQHRSFRPPSRPALRAAARPVVALVSIVGPSLVGTHRQPQVRLCPYWPGHVPPQPPRTEYTRTRLGAKWLAR
jgi:hypothetical protein